MMTEEEIRNDYIKTVKSIRNGESSSWKLGYAQALCNVLGIGEDDWVEMIKE